MNLDPEYIRQNLNEIGIKEAKAILRECINNSNNSHLRKQALRVYSSIEKGKEFKFFEQLFLSDEDPTLRLLTGQILKESYLSNKKIISLLDFILNNENYIDLKFQALEILKTINTKKANKIIKDYIRKVIKLNFDGETESVLKGIIRLDDSSSISESILEIYHNILLYDHYTKTCGYTVILRNSLITLLNCEGMGLKSILDIPGFDKLVNLEYLYLQKNELSKIQNLEHLKYLKILNLGNNNIEKIENLDSLRNLEELILSNNKIIKIENLNLKNLKKLSIDRNYITDIRNLEGLNTLESLNLSNNNISEIAELKKLNKLKYLTLSHNKINKINGLQNLHNLIMLQLNDNYIIEISGLESQINLKVLNLTNNRIEKIKNLDKLENLKKLELSNNRIQYIQGLSNLKKLQELFLDKNQIKSLEGIDGLISLIILFLENNQISEFQLKQIESLRNLNFLFLNENPLNAKSTELYKKLSRLP